jgi:hypothetical protein
LLFRRSVKLQAVSHGASRVGASPEPRRSLTVDNNVIQREAPAR